MEKKNYENPNNSNKIREKSKKNPIQRSNSSLGKTILMYCISENIKNSTGCVYYSDERLTKDPLAQNVLNIFTDAFSMNDHILRIEI